MENKLVTCSILYPRPLSINVRPRCSQCTRFACQSFFSNHDNQPKSWQVPGSQTFFFPISFFTFHHIALLLSAISSLVSQFHPHPSLFFLRTFSKLEIPGIPTINSPIKHSLLLPLHLIPLLLLLFTSACSRCRLLGISTSEFAPVSARDDHKLHFTIT